MLSVLDQQEQLRVDSISEQVRRVYEEHKTEIERIISDNYGLKREESLLSLFRSLGLVLSRRNNQLLDFLAQKYGLNFKDAFDFVGGIRIGEGLITEETPENIRTFFQKGYVRNNSSDINSRGYGYYFNLGGISMDSHNFKLNTQEYLNNLRSYYNDVILYLGEFNGRNIGELDEFERKLLLIGLEHYKNILLLLQNFVNSVSNKTYLSKHVLNVSPRIFDTYFVDISGNTDFSAINNFLTEELESVISNFSDLVLGVRGSNVIKYRKNDSIEAIFHTMQALFEGSFQKQQEHKGKLEKKQKSGNKQTDFASIERTVSKLNNKLIGNLLRIIREEDNPIKQLLACHNISGNIPAESSSMDLVGVLYGGIEMPYFMKYVLTRFGGRNSGSINIRHIGLSTYNNRNLMQTSALENYSPLGLQDGSLGGRLQVLLDDNLFYGGSLQVASNIAGSKGPVYAGVTEIGLRRGHLGKLSEGNNLNYLLSKIPDSGSTTPTQRNGKVYKNMVTRHILRKLPGLVGRL